MDSHESCVQCLCMVYYMMAIHTARHTATTEQLVVVIRIQFNWQESSSFKLTLKLVGRESYIEARAKRICTHARREICIRYDRLL